MEYFAKTAPVNPLLALMGAVFYQLMHHLLYFANSSVIFMLFRYKGGFYIRKDTSEAKRLPMRLEALLHRHLVCQIPCQ